MIICSEMNGRCQVARWLPISCDAPGCRRQEPAAAAVDRFVEAANLYREHLIGHPSAVRPWEPTTIRSGRHSSAMAMISLPGDPMPASARISQPGNIEWIRERARLASANEFSQSVARRAYEYFEARGREFGHDLEDWFRAESELMRRVPVELKEANGRITVRAEVPGFAANEVKISVEPPNCARRSIRFAATWRGNSASIRSSASRLR
jgi:hypothetical protein